jgi:hypothetical protein
MKFGPKGLRFLAPVWPHFRGHRYFLARQSTIHLQETALVVEGYQMRFRLPLVEWPIRGLLSEWTTLTIPYSHIVWHVHQRYRIAKTLYWLGGAVVLLLGVMLLAYSAGRPGANASVMLLLLLVFAIGLVLFGILVHLVLRPRHLLAFRGEDGKQQLLCFRFQSPKHRREFLQLLQANRAVVETTAEL